MLASLLFVPVFSFAEGIGSAKELQDFIDACNKGESVLPWASPDSVVCLSADIDLSKVKKLPQVMRFGGRFDGRGHALRNWKTSHGLFHLVCAGAEVKGLVIESSCSLKAASKGDEFCAGFIADVNEGIIRDCINRGTVAHKCEYALAPIYVGGITGSNRFVVLSCRNEGGISSEVYGEAKESVSLNLGGISGGASGKLKAGAVIARCENTGEISARGNLAAAFIGGVSGNSVRSSLKYCINRGEVTAAFSETENNAAAGADRVGGIVGQTKADVLRCRNYGDVKAQGASSASVGGIAGMPHEALVIADCANYGKIVSAAEQPSHTGGIAGNIGRPVHVRGCVNYGEVRFEGVSSRSRSTAGGIVGNIYVTKTAVAGAYVRDCANHGDVFAAAGGNKYDSNNRNAIHCAGVVAYAESRPGLRAFVSECSNDGKVTCERGRKGNIIASAVSVKTGGTPTTEFAQAASARPDGVNLWGHVSSPEGEPLEGIVVTDGIQCVKTDHNGLYEFHSDLSEAHFVYLSLPPDVEIPTCNGISSFFRRIPCDAEAAVADFSLKRKQVATDYTVLMIADPQVRPYGMDNSMEAWAAVVAPDVEAFSSSCAGEVYAINLGDLVYNYMSAWDDYLDAAVQIKCPIFNVIGNHDYDQANLFETNQGNICFETYLGPEHYSFDLGNIHYIVMNDILYDRASASDKYHYGLDDKTLAWLEADLSFVPEDKVIVTCTHHNLFKTPASSPNGSHNAYSLHYKDYLALLSAYKEVYAWNGHNHENFYYNYAGKETRHGAPNIQCISVARCTGALRLNQRLGARGEPQGYMVLKVKGDDLEWQYKSVGQGLDCQMRGYTPDQTPDGKVMVNIWNWSEGWSVPAWYENGAKAADFEYTPGVDKDYLELYSTVTNETTKKYCKPSAEAKLFSVTPSRGATGGEVRVTDMFGNEYRLQLTWQ